MSRHIIFFVCSGIIAEQEAVQRERIAKLSADRDQRDSRLAQLETLVQLTNLQYEEKDEIINQLRVRSTLVKRLLCIHSLTVEFCGILITLLVIIIIYNSLPPPRKGRQVKSDYIITHTINQLTPLSSYT